jgi:hypothetical protein
MKTKNAKATVTAQPAGAAGKTAQAATILHLEVKMGVVMRGARAAWYERLCKYDGKPASDYLASCKETPPSVPKSGVPEAPQGWLSYFTRTGVAKVVQAQ